MANKLFRQHRGMLAESLATTIEVKDLADMRQKILSDWEEFASYVSNIRIDKVPIQDDRLPPEWGGTSYYVVADFNGGGHGYIGMCNFYEE